MRTWFATYGDDKWAAAKARICAQARETGVFDVVLPFEREPFLVWADGAAIPSRLSRAARGGGFWLWKPWVVRTTLDEMAEGDVLVYADAGCHLRPSGAGRLREYMEMVRHDPWSVLAFSLEDFHAERMWTTEAVLSEFKSSERTRASPQLMATILVMRKCPATEALIDGWYGTAVFRPDLFSDDHNEDARRACPDFKDHRHDQSVLSVLRKSSPFCASVLTLRDESYHFLGPDKPFHAARDKS